MTKNIKIEVLIELFKNKKQYRISQEEGHQGVSHSSGIQGEYNERFVVYRHPDMPKNLFLMETYHTDSYGYNEFMIDYKFVESKEKNVITYEELKSK